MFFAAILLVAFSGLSAQTIEIPYNPDVNDDAMIGSNDLLSLLPIYGAAFVPDSVLIDGQSLQNYLEENSGNTSLLFPGTEVGQVLFWTGTEWSFLDLGSQGQVLMVQEGLPAWSDLPSNGIISVGCTDSTACNYNPAAMASYNVLCIQLDALGECGGPCLSDSNGNGICDSDESISGCTDPSACNYNPEANVDDGTCTALDACGVCGGDGSSCPPELQSCGDVSFDGHIYSTVVIGAQCWLQESLRSSHFTNGDPILGELTEIEWEDIETSMIPAQSVYNDDLANLEYGRLYNQYAVLDSRGLCPTGWHVPDEDDFIALELQLGMPLSDVGVEFYYGVLANVGGQMREVGNDHWDSSNNGATNSSGFTALGGGFRDFTGGYHYLNSHNWIWLADDFRHATLEVGQAGVYHGGHGGSTGMSVRCVQDTTQGCTDSSSCNFDPAATLDDGSCLAWDECGVCDGDGTSCVPYCGNGILEEGEACDDGNNIDGDGCSECTVDVAWNQLGADIDGEAAGDYSGHNVSLSSDGSIVAVGAHGNDGVNGSESGHVRLHQWNGTAWTQLGEDIDGEAEDDYSGGSVSLSADGTVVAIGAKTNDGNGDASGHVRLYQWSGTAWSQLGQDIDGEWHQDWSGNVSLSADGSIVAIGAIFNGNLGHVRLFQWNGSTWSQLGEDIDGEANGDHSGYSVSLSADGSIVAIGGPENDGNGDHSGHVRLYQWSGAAWNQLGEDIDGEAEDDHSGGSVSLSSDGSIVAIGAIGAHENGYDSGHVRLYEWNGSAWNQLGEDIDGEAAHNYSGESVSLSSDGTIVAIGAPNADGNGNNSGHVRLYQWNGAVWNQLGEDIDGEAAGDRSGYSVSLSADGTIVAIGAYQNDENGSGSGHVRVFSFEQ